MTRNTAQGFGLTAELAAKTAAKYSSTDETQIYQWFNQLGLPSGEPGHDNFYEFLKDGIVLCQLANKIQPGAVNKVHDVTKVKIAAMRNMKMQENISFFIEWCKRYGMAKSDPFATVDLFDKTNLSSVQSCIIKVGALAKKNGFSGPAIGVKLADKNTRSFDEQTLREGRNVIGLQMGTNKHASQAGMSAYGATRQIIDRTSHLEIDEQTRVGRNAPNLQTGTNLGASQAGMSGYGATREIVDRTSKESGY